MSAFEQWGPVFLVVSSILLSVIHYNHGLNELRSHLEARFDELCRHLDNLASDLDPRVFRS
jgi:hypothetical protein